MAESSSWGGLSKFVIALALELFVIGARAALGGRRLVYGRQLQKASMAAAHRCGVCDASLDSMTAHGRKTHVGLCRKKKQRPCSPMQAPDLDLELSAHEDSSPPASPAQMDMDIDFEAGPALPGFEAGPALPEAATHAPFLSEAEAKLAQLFVEKGNIGIGTLDAILAITQSGEELATSTKEMLQRLDELPGMEYRCAELTLSGYPDATYRMFFRELKAAVDHLLRMHGHVLLQPVLLPPDFLTTNGIEEMWQGQRYQEMYRDFSKHAAPTDVLLPLILFSGTFHL